MPQLWRGMPAGVRVFLAYAFLVLAFIGVTLPLVVAQAVSAPISPLGIVWMALLAYLIFTMTLVLQRKEAAYPLALGLATLTVPLIPMLYLSPAGIPGALFAVVVAVLVFGSLRRPGVRSWFNEP
ncbi:MAG: hypothetical protein H0T04_04305 [Chloroflexi bacterium]|nr:hypothetical protein [Chloroflexota bacterium]MBA3852675.1 hypothetical protein [Chloroflexota bacterium]